jgi:cytochrome c-type biogenesis protein CcmE
MSIGKKQSPNVAGGRYVQPAEVLELGVTLDMTRSFLIGVVKPGSIKIQSGTHKHTFVLTDFIHEITVNYDGTLPSNFREGETARIQGDFVDQYNPSSFIALGIQAAHDAEQPKTTYKPRSKDIAEVVRNI